MTRTSAVLLAAVLALAPAACKRKTVKVGTDEETPRMRSVLAMGDSKVEPQLVSGFYGGRLDLLLMRAVDAQLAIPSLLLLIAVVAVLGAGLAQIVVVLAVASWPTYARVLRAEALSLKEREFVVAARATGLGDGRILRRHILPNVLPTVIVLATLQLPTVILWEAALSFLGLGIQPPTPSLGQMLGHSQEVVWRAWWMPAIPGTTISLVTLGFNVLGDRARDVLDSRLRGIGHD